MSSLDLPNKERDYPMGDSGKKDKGKRETQKKAAHTPKEKRALKNAKKGKTTTVLTENN